MPSLMHSQVKISIFYAFMKFPESKQLRVTIMPCDICVFVCAGIDSNGIRFTGLLSGLT